MKNYVRNAVQVPREFSDETEARRQVEPRVSILITSHHRSDLQRKKSLKG
jgi:hypothetical protein